jgi:tRNA(adenine34) deaminase
MVNEGSPQPAGPKITDAALTQAWDEALRLAWEALKAETTPVGAVVVDGAGRVVGAGRGRRYETAGPAGQLAGSHIAHAEVNALAQLESGHDWEYATLLTTLEPCGMCHGAAIQSTVTRLYFAGRDPYGGTGGLRFDTPQARRRQLCVAGPLPGACGTLAEILHIAFLLSRASAAHVVRVHDETMPGLTSYTRQIRAVLDDALRRDDYPTAVALAATAPRDR